MSVNYFITKLFFRILTKLFFEFLQSFFFLVFIIYQNNLKSVHLDNVDNHEVFYNGNSESPLMAPPLIRR